MSIDDLVHRRPPAVQLETIAAQITQVSPAGIFVTPIGTAHQVGPCMGLKHRIRRLPSRKSISASSGALAAAAEAELQLVLPAAGVIARVSVSSPARVRLYDQAAKSAADATRPAGDVQLIVPAIAPVLEVVDDGAGLALDLNPAPAFANRDGGRVYQLRVQNASAALKDIEVTLTLGLDDTGDPVPLEAGAIVFIAFAGTQPWIIAVEE